MDINPNADFKKAWNQVINSSEEKILKMEANARQQLFNKAIHYASLKPNMLADSSSSIKAKFIRCTPADCATRIGMSKVLNFLHNNNAFYENSWFDSIFSKKTLIPELVEALDSAIVSGNEAMAIALFEHGFPFTQDTFLLACQYGREEVVKYLIKNGSDIHDLRAILSACRNGHSAVVRSLIENGADINKLKVDGHSILYIVCRENRFPEMIDLLLKNGAKLQKNEVESFARNIGTWGIKNELLRIELAKLCMRHGDIGEFFANFNIKDEQVRIELAKYSVEVEPEENRRGKKVSYAVDFIKQFNITDKQELTNIAKLYAQYNEYEVAQGIGNFEIENKEVLAKICAKDGRVARFIKKFKIEDENIRIEIAELCAKTNVEAVLMYFNEFNITSEEARIVLAKQCASRSGALTADYFKAFDIKNEQARAEIIKICFQNNGLSLYDYIGNLGVKVDDEALKKLIRHRDPIQILNSDFKNEINQLNLTDALQVIDEIKEPKIKELKIQQIVEIIFMLKALLKSDQIKVFCEQGILSQALSFGRTDLRAPLYRAAILSRRDPRYSEVATSLPKIEPDIPWKKLIHELFVMLRLQGVDHDTFHQIIGDIDKNRIFLNGKKVQIFVDMLFKLTQELELTANEKQIVLQRIFTEGHQNAQKTAYSRVISEGRELQKKLPPQNKKALQDYQQKIIAMKHAEKEGAATPTDKELGLAIFDNMYAVIAILGFERTNVLTNQEITLKDHLESVFKDIMPIGKIQDFTAKYSSIFMESRNPTALPTYAAKMNSLRDKKRSLDCLSEYVSSVLNGTFSIKRYDPDSNHHLKTIKEIDATIIEKWKQPIPPVSTDTSSEKITPDTLLTWLTNLKIESNELNYLKQFLEAANAVDRNKAKEDCKTDWEKTKNVKALNYEQKNKLRLQNLLFQLIDAKDSQKRLGFIKQINLLKLEHLVNPKFKEEAGIIKEKIENSLKIIKTVVSESDDPIDLLLCGTEVISCQDVNGNPETNKGLLGYIMDGKNRLLVIKDSDGKIMARCLLRLLLNDAQQPVLFRGFFYPDVIPVEYQKAFNQMVHQKADSLGVPVAYLNRDSQGKPYPGSLQSLGGPAPWEYCDEAFGINKNGIFTIPKCQVLE